MTKKQLINYLVKKKDILSIRAIGKKTGFINLYKVLNKQVDMGGHPFTFPDKHVKPVLKEIRRLQVKRRPVY